jgi:ribosome assembly protein 1
MAPTKIANVTRGTVRGAGLHDLVKFTIRATPLPQAIFEFIFENLSTLKLLHQDQKSKESTENDLVDSEDEGEDSSGGAARKATASPTVFWLALEEKCKASGGEWEDITDRIWAFGPQRAGGCVLIDSRKTSTPHSLVFVAYCFAAHSFAVL